MNPSIRADTSGVLRLGPRISKNARVKVTKITENYSFAQYRADNPSFIPLFYIDVKNKLHVVTAENFAKIPEDVRLVSLVSEDNPNETSKKVKAHESAIKKAVEKKAEKQAKAEAKEAKEERQAAKHEAEVSALTDAPDAPPNPKDEPNKDRSPTDAPLKTPEQKPAAAPQSSAPLASVGIKPVSGHQSAEVTDDLDKGQNEVVENSATDTMSSTEAESADHLKALSTADEVETEVLDSQKQNPDAAHETSDTKTHLSAKELNEGAQSQDSVDLAGQSTASGSTTSKEGVKLASVSAFPKKSD